MVLTIFSNGDRFDVTDIMDPSKPHILVGTDVIRKANVKGRSENKIIISSLLLITAIYKLINIADRVIPENVYYFELTENIVNYDVLIVGLIPISKPYHISGYPS